MILIPFLPIPSLIELFNLEETKVIFGLLSSFPGSKQ